MANFIMRGSRKISITRCIDDNTMALAWPFDGKKRNRPKAACTALRRNSICQAGPAKINTVARNRQRTSSCCHCEPNAPAPRNNRRGELPNDR